MQMNKKDKRSLIAIVSLSLLVIIVVFSTDPYPQPQSYHNFADQHTHFNIPHFLNVASNLPFLIVGLLGLYSIFKQKCQILHSHRLTYQIFFIGVTLVSFGSSYYHLDPNNHTLIWDRLPMAFAFMALFTFIIAEFISEKLALKVRYPLLVIGVFSVVYWAWSEVQQVGDLRFYFLVQFLPIMMTPFILIRFKSRFTHVGAYWMLLVAYMVAKILETLDHEVYALIGFVSGHSLKHIVAALGVWFLLGGMKERKGLTTD